MTASWKTYPYTPDWGDPRWFTFPAADGGRSDLGVATYYIDAFLTGRTTGRRYAFIVIFTDMRVLGKRLRASFYTFALYDLDRRRYGTYTDYDFPRPPRVRRRSKVSTMPGHLELRYEASAGTASWTNQRDGGGGLRPFAWDVDLCGVDHHGAGMRLVLAIDATRPPAPLGGRELGGAMMFLGAPVTYSYFQSGLAMSGRIAWGDAQEEVDGTIGWIDRQWAVDDFSAFQDRRSTRYRSEWRVMQLDDGWDMSLFHQYHRPRHNAVVPWSGFSAQGPAPEHALRMATDVELVIPEFIRSPGVVRARDMLTEGPRWFPHRYRVRVPEWELDVSAEPLVDAPAHALPIEYWTGPVRIRGTHRGRPVSGFGFDERSRPWARDFEIAAAIGLTVRHLPDVDAGTRRMLCYHAWEVEALAMRDDARSAAAHARARVVPLVDALAPPARARVDPMVQDLLAVLDAGRRVP